MPISFVRIAKIAGVVCLVATMVYYGGITLVSHLPGVTFRDMTFYLGDKVMHALAFFPLGVLLALGMRLRPLRVEPGRARLLGVLIIGLLGIVDEVHQSFVPGRFSTWGDAAADLVGGGFGVMLATIQRKIRSASSAG